MCNLRTSQPRLWPGLGLLLILLLVGCSNGVRAADISGSGAQRGQRLYNLHPLENMPGCTTCHTLHATGVETVGPPLAGIATRAAELQAETGLSAADLLRQSMIEPNAYLWPGYNRGAMPRYSDSLSVEDLNDIVDYLLTLD